MEYYTFQITKRLKLSDLHQIKYPMPRPDQAYHNDTTPYTSDRIHDVPPRILVSWDRIKDTLILARTKRSSRSVLDSSPEVVFISSKDTLTLVKRWPSYNVCSRYIFLLCEPLVPLVCYRGREKVTTSKQDWGNQ